MPNVEERFTHPRLTNVRMKCPIPLLLVRLSRTLLLLAGLTGAVLLGPRAAQATKDALVLRTEIAAIPWNPEPLIFNEKVIYGNDDRLDVFEVADPARLQQAAATCAIVYAESLTDNGNGTFTLAMSEYIVQGFPACDGEPFADQPIAALCSGFLAAEDIIVTAGHCLTSADLPGLRFIFGFEMQDDATPITTFDQSQVYTGIEVISRRFDLDGPRDYSIVRLDRQVSAGVAKPLAMRTEGTPPVGTQIGVIGHPFGLPKKIAFGEQTRVGVNDSEVFFEANLDTFQGNSGSPVFNVETGLVEGILVRGAQDYDFTAGDCFLSYHLDDVDGQTPLDNTRGEEVTKSTFFAPFLTGDPGEGEGDGAGDGAGEGAGAGDGAGEGQSEDTPNGCSAAVPNQSSSTMDHAKGTTGDILILLLLAAALHSTRANCRPETTSASER